MNQLQPTGVATGVLRSLGIWAGKKLAPFTGKNVFSVSKHNEVLAAANCFLNPQVHIGGTSPQVFVGDSGWGIQIPAGTTAGPAGTGNMNYRGAYSAGTDYAVDDVVYTGSTPAARYFYVCEIANGPGTSVHATDPTEAGTIYWRLISQPPGGITPAPANFIIGSDGIIRCLRISTLSGRVYIAGDFAHVGYYNTSGTLVADSLRTGVATLKATMEIDAPASFVNITGVFARQVFGMGVRSDDSLYIAGQFFSVNDAQRANASNQGAAVLTAAGDADSGFNPGTTFTSPSYPADALTCYGDRMLFIGGFTSVASTARYGAAMLDLTGAVDTSFVPPLSSDVNESFYNANHIFITDQTSGAKVFLTGPVFYNSGSSIGLVRFDLSGTIDATLAIGVGFAGGGTSGLGYNPAVGTDIYIGGNFTSYKGGAVGPGLCKISWTGTLDASWVPVVTFSGGAVLDLCLQADGKLLVAGGGLATVNGVAKNGLARLLSSGALDTSFTPDINSGGTVYRVAQHPDGRIVVVGDFTSVGGHARHNIAHLDLAGNVLS
jgi:Domain of unknown function (DUF5122) beta-propeller